MKLCSRPRIEPFRSMSNKIDAINKKNEKIVTNIRVVFLFKTHHLNLSGANGTKGNIKKGFLMMFTNVLGVVRK